VQLVIYVDAAGIAKVELLSASGETGGRDLFLALHSQIEALGIAAQKASCEIVAREEMRHELA
jgi:hypothetical protein